MGPELFGCKRSQSMGVGLFQFGGVERVYPSKNRRKTL